MNEQASNEISAWTWKDQIKTYRFWGLFAFYLLTSTAMVIITTSIKTILRLDYDFTPGEIQNLVRLMTVGGVIGFYFAWKMTRGKTVSMLIMMGVFELLGNLLMAVSLWSVNIYIVGAGMLLIGMGAGAVFIGVPAILAGGRGGSSAFVVPFGILMTVASLAKFISSPASAYLVNNYGNKGVTGAAATAVLVGIIFLLPVNRALFDEPPPGRDESPPSE